MDWLTKITQWSFRGSTLLLYDNDFNIIGEIILTHPVTNESIEKVVYELNELLGDS